MWTSTLVNHDGLPVQWGVVLGASLAAAAFDVKERRIPNLITLPMLAAGLVWAVVVTGWAGLGDSLLGVLLLGVPYVLLYAFAGGGAGDAKLMGAIGAWLGVAHGAVALLCVVAAGGLLGIGVALARREGKKLAGNLIWITHGLLAVSFARRGLTSARELMPETSSMRTMPYGLCIFVGVIAAAVTVWLAHI